MSAPSTPSPSFRRPPVVETVLTVQFASLPGFLPVHLIDWFQQNRTDYPQFLLERALRPIRLPLRLREGLPASRPPGSGSPRAVVRSDDGNWAVQFQADRLAVNWRGSESVGPYPRFRAAAERFGAVWERFLRFAREEGLGRVRPEVGEVRYLNLIPPPDVPVGEDFARVLCVAPPNTPDRFPPLPPPTACELNRTFEFPADNGWIDRGGRLLTEASLTAPGDSPDRRTLFKLTAQVTMEGGPEVASGLSAAHDLVTHGFVALTDGDVRRDRWQQDH